jgi:hypothetical protein
MTYTEDTLSETPDTTQTEIESSNSSDQATTGAPVKASKSTPSRRGRSAGKAPAKRSTTRPARSSSSSSRSGGSSSGSDAAGSLAAALRSLVGGIENEVSSISGLSGEIDTHVQALNDLRAEATRRLLHLDDLRAAAEDVNLSAFLDTSIQPQLPQVEEDFPDRIYGGS